MVKLRDSGRRFGLVCLDPPAFIKRRKDAAQGLAAYRKAEAERTQGLTDEQKALVRQLTRPTSYQQDEAATAEKAREKLRDQVRHFIAAMNQPK